MWVVETKQIERLETFRSPHWSVHLKCGAVLYSPFVALESLAVYLADDKGRMECPPECPHHDTKDCPVRVMRK